MRQRCDCGRLFERLYRKTPDGHEYTVTGCPVCLDNAETTEALDELVRATHRMQFLDAPEDG